jgi:hypothetical protein
MNWRNITGIVIGVAIVALLGYDGVVIWKTNDQMSISQFVWDLSRNKPIFSFGMGFAMGHLFFH